MQEFRRFTEGTLGKVVLVVITLPFVVAGFYGYFSSGAGADQVAKVGDASISMTALSNQVQSARQRVRQSNPNVDADMLARFVSPQMVLEGMVNNALLDQAAKDARMVVSQKQISHEIVTAPSFKDDKGNFSETLFEQQIGRMGYTPASFIGALQQQAVRTQVQAAYSLTDFALPNELQTLRQLSGQTRDLEYTQVSLADTAADTKVSDADVKAYFDAHKDNYKRPPQVRIQWVEIQPSNYQIKVSAEQVEKEYNARKQVLEEAAAQNQSRKVGDIFIAINKTRDADQAKALAEKLAAELAKGADFATLAKANSDDQSTAQKGGDLGWLMQEALPEDMGKAIFALNKGDVSAPLKTDSGYHLFTVEDIKKQAMPSLDSTRADIEKTIRQQELLSKISNDSSQLSDLAYEHSDLTVPAEKLGLQIHTSDWFAIDAPTGFAANPKVHQALQDAAVVSQGQNSQLLDLGDNHYAVIHVSDHRDAAQLDFASVKEQVEQQLKLEQAQAQLAKLKDVAAKADDVKTIASLWHSKATQVDALKRRDTRLAADVLAQVFALPPAASSKPELLSDAQGNLWALSITKVTAGSSETEAGQQRAELAQLGAMQGEQSFRSYVSWLRSSTEIEINEDKLKSAR